MALAALWLVLAPCCPTRRVSALPHLVASRCAVRG